MILIIDNKDSFASNLYHAVCAVRSDVKVIRNDELGVEQIKSLAPEKIILSPGHDKGATVEFVKKIHSEVPILGICLGMHIIYEAFGGQVGYAKKLMHGKASEVSVDTQHEIFADLPPFIQAGRYHSLACNRDSLPENLEIISQTDDGEIMAIRHRNFPIFGLQFYPHSILTPQGQRIIENFLAHHTVSTFKN
ncbi:MAG: aminodeoxychorismate/anthranilate synthase component II [Defluviitaleaceae bacterium]|nr:aminodeoxychorismate/anthranilate synthase component II [Defluviitaleaceae bacterium]